MSSLGPSLSLTISGQSFSDSASCAPESCTTNNPYRDGSFSACGIESRRGRGGGGGGEGSKGKGERGGGGSGGRRGRGWRGKGMGRGWGRGKGRRGGEMGKRDSRGNVSIHTVAKLQCTCYSVTTCMYMCRCMSCMLLAEGNSLCIT